MHRPVQKNGQTDKSYIRNDIARAAIGATDRWLFNPSVKSYNAYLGISGKQEDPWECTATSVGYERVQPGSPYPPRRHPVDHHFDWDHGRVLSAYQLVYVIEGQGAFESEVSPKCHRIESRCRYDAVPWCLAPLRA